MQHLSAPSVRPKSPRLANFYQYVLFINRERIGKYLLLSDLLDTIKTVSGRNHIKIQRTNTLTGKHTFFTPKASGMNHV